MGREEEIEYARRHGIPIKGGAEQTPYSIDDNLWGRSSEGRWIEDLAHAPDDDVFQLVTRPELAPDEPRVVEVGFERGVPVSLDGERLGLVELIERAGALGIEHGIGIVDHIEDRIVGLKVRDIYEVPAATILLLAHAELERLVGTIHQNQFKPDLDRQWAYLVYAGLWWEPLRSNLDAYMDAVNERVTGTIGIKLFKGHARVVTRSSPNAVYDASLATFETSGGLFSQQASPGFIELWSLQSRLAHRLHERGGGGGGASPPGGRTGGRGFPAPAGATRRPPWAHAARRRPHAAPARRGLRRGQRARRGRVGRVRRDGRERAFWLLALWAAPWPSSSRDRTRPDGVGRPHALPPARHGRLEVRHLVPAPEVRVDEDAAAGPRRRGRRRARGAPARHALARRTLRPADAVGSLACPTPPT